jgi:hypothetical protein
MIATTIISSTRVKPRWFRIFLCQKLNMSVSSSLGLGFGPPERPRYCLG